MQLLVVSVLATVFSLYLTLGDLVPRRARPLTALAFVLLLSTSVGQAAFMLNVQRDADRLARIFKNIVPTIFKNMVPTTTTTARGSGAPLPASQRSSAATDTR